MHPFGELVQLNKDTVDDPQLRTNQLTLYSTPQFAEQNAPTAAKGRQNPEFRLWKEAKRQLQDEENDNHSAITSDSFIMILDFEFLNKVRRSSCSESFVLSLGYLSLLSCSSRCLHDWLMLARKIFNHLLCPKQASLKGPQKCQHDT